jgi:hypothetical protein
MAKKKTAPGPEGVNAEERRGRKVCPGCHEICGARLRECKKCGHVFRLKSEPTGKMALSPYRLQAVMQFVAVAGGFPAARQALHEAEAFLKHVEAWKEKVGKGPT